MSHRPIDEQPVAFTFGDLQGPLNYERFFSRPGPVELEIGSGRGDFLIAYAKQNPAINLIGIERKLVIARRAAAKISRAELHNVRLICGEVFYFLERYVPPTSLVAIHCYFPDPWPKKRHAKRRLFQQHTLEVFARVLRPGGHIFIRTDVPGYFDVIRELFARNPNFYPVEIPPALLQCLTGFERRFILDAKPIYRAAYTYEPAPVGALGVVEEETSKALQK